MGPFSKYYLKKMIMPLGINLRGAKPFPKRMFDFTRFLASTGYRPATIIDVGVADGTLDLYLPFPDARLLLIEPVAVFERPIRRLLTRFDGVYVQAAAGGEAGVLELTFSGGMAGAHNASASNAESTSIESPTKVPMRRVDEIVRTEAMSGPYLMKVDVEGFEANVVSGATEILPEVDVLILETALFQCDGKRLIFHEIIDQMAQQGFVPYALFDGSSRPLDGAPCLIDVAFVKRDGRFRASQLWRDPNVKAGLLERLRSSLSV